MNRKLMIVISGAFTAGILAVSFGWSEFSKLLSLLAVFGVSAIVLLAMRSERYLEGVEERLAEEREKSAEKIKQLSWQDQSTGLYSYNWFKQALTREVSRSDRYKQSCALLWISLDKDDLESQSIHAAYANPDHVWRFIADLVSASVRNTDTVARCPGEYTVVVLLPQTDSEGAEIVSRRLDQRLMIEKLEIVDGIFLRARFHQRRVSFPIDADSADDLIKTAQNL